MPDKLFNYKVFLENSLAKLVMICIIQQDSDLALTVGSSINVDPIFTGNAAVFTGSITLPAGITNLNLNQSCCK